MRKFSEREQKVIRDLVQGASTSFTYLAICAYGDIFQRECVEFVKSSEALFFYSPQGNIPSHEKVFQVTGEIYEVSYLIDYLEKEGLIRHFSVGTGQLEDKYPFNFNSNGLSPLSVSIDPVVARILYNNVNYPIYVTQTLVTLVHDGFRTLEEQTFDEAKEQTKEAKKQSCLSSIAVLLAMLTLLFSALQGFKGCTNSSVHDDNSTSQITVPITGIVNYMKNNIEGKLNATMENTADIRMQIRDTISVNVTSCPCKKRHITIRPVDNCLKTVRINICEDTVVAKKNLR